MLRITYNEKIFEKITNSFENDKFRIKLVQWPCKVYASPKPFASRAAHSVDLYTKNSITLTKFSTYICIHECTHVIVDSMPRMRGKPRQAFDAR